MNDIIERLIIACATDTIPLKPKRRFAMLRVTLALGLFVTPAIAEEYTEPECETLDIMLNNCTEKPLCQSVLTGYEARRFKELQAAHPSWLKELDLPPEQRAFNKVCNKVCEGKVTPLDALEKFCP